jgi:hypothetical protein
VFRGGLGNPVHIPAFSPEFTKHPHDMLVPPELHGVDTAFHTAKECFLDPLAGKEIFHFLIHLTVNVGITAKRVSSDYQTADPGFTNGYQGKHCFPP